MSRLNTAYTYFYIAHAIFLVFIIGYTGLSVWRKHKFAPFQWAQILQLTFLNIVQVTVMYLFDDNLVSNNCGAKLMLFGIAIWILYIAIALFISWQFLSFFG